MLRPYLNIQIAKLSPGRERRHLERIGEHLDRSGAITLYLHGERELFTLPMLKASIPAVTAANWSAFRDYILYGPQVSLTSGPGALLCVLASSFCSRKTMHLIVIPAIADLRLEYEAAVRERRFLDAFWIRVRSGFDFFRTLLLCVVRNVR